MIEPATPEWARDAVFYQIFPDRFAKSAEVFKPANIDTWGSPPARHRYQGGDLLGVVEKLDYLTDLGVNAVYFTPIFQSASNHRYHTHDYEKVDPMLGGNVALKRLVDEAHRRGIRVVLDGVFNHASRGFFPFHDILENGADSAYLDWFHVSGFPLNAYDPDKSPAYHAWWGLPALPKFNIRTPAVREFLWGIARKWIDLGIDGWRLDVANEIDDDEFWREFRRRVRDGNPNAYILGEVWSESTRWLNNGDMWDAVMNYPLTRACLAFFGGPKLDPEPIRPTSLYPVGPTDGGSFRKTIEWLIGLYPWPVTSVMLNLLGSHDMARLLTLARGDRSTVRLATLFLMTYSGAPSIYYGDEIGMEGGHDPDNRRAFPWHDLDSWDNELRRDFQRMIALRHQYHSLRRGSFEVLHSGEDTFAHARTLGTETTVAAFNVGEGTRRVDLSASKYATEGAAFEPVWGRGSYRVEGGSLRGVELAPRSAVVLIYDSGR